MVRKPNTGTESEIWRTYWEDTGYGIREWECCEVTRWVPVCVQKHQTFRRRRSRRGVVERFIWLVVFLEAWFHVLCCCAVSFSFFSIDVRGIVGWVRSNGVKSAQATGGVTKWSGLAPKYCYCFAVFGLCVYSRSVNNSKLSDGELCVVCLVEFIAKKNSRCESRGLFLSNWVHIQHH